MAYSINYTPSKVVNWGNMSLKPPNQLVWDQIFRKDGRIFLEPFPHFDELVEPSSCTAVRRSWTWAAVAGAIPLDW